MLDIPTVESRLHALYIAAEGATLRREDLKKAREITAMLQAMDRMPRDAVLVDAAAGKAYVGLLAADLLGFRRVVVIERDAARVAAGRNAAAALRCVASVAFVQADVEDPSAWPSAPGLVVALHACGGASDAVLDATVSVQARNLLLVPCCYGTGVRFTQAALRIVEDLGVPRHAPVRQRALQSLVDAWRTLRLEAAGYETVVSALVPPTVTPHNLVWRARRVQEPGRMRHAHEDLQRLVRHAGAVGPVSGGALSSRRSSD